MRRGLLEIFVVFLVRFLNLEAIFLVERTRSLVRRLYVQPDFSEGVLRGLPGRFGGPVFFF
jgi:hypothetical protein